MATNKVFIAVTVTFVLFLVIASVVSIFKGGSFIIPGLAPMSWEEGQPVPLLVNKVTSIHTPVPYRYYDLPVCQFAEYERIQENLGEVITGNRIETSAYKLKMKKPVKPCELLCFREFSQDDVAMLSDLIKDTYVVQWQLDSLPAATKGISQKTKDIIYDTGFPLGYTKDNKIYINNHVHLIVYYHEEKTPATTEGTSNPPLKYNIVLFEVKPHSVEYNYNKDSPDAWKPICDQAESSSSASTPCEVRTPLTVLYTYSVTWERSATVWADRWQNYLALQGEGQIHWFSIVNSLMIVFFLSGLVAMIMARTIRRDFMKYLEEEKDEVEESGWKLVRADVFRPPRFKTFFAVLIGSGVQVFTMCVVTMVFAVLGFLSPSNSGSLTTAVLVLYVWMGVAAGYTSSRIYLMFEGDHRTRNTLLTAFLFPGTVFGIAFFLNFFLWYKGSSGAFPFTTMLAIFALWFCISVPLCFLGSRLAYRKEPPKHPGTVNHIPRQIPPQKWYMHPVLSVLLGGILPFGAVFIELFFIMSSIWLHRYYFLFGFLFLVFIILVVTCAEISVVMCYFQLCSEDWHWWWRSFLTPAVSAFYMFLYAIFYYAQKLEVDGFVPSLLYFGYSLIMCLYFAVLTGTIGYYSCYWFVKNIYRAIHQD